MNESEASVILNSMVDFIRSHGEERVATIKKQTEEEFTIQKEAYIAEEKDKVIADFKEKIRKDEINLKIEKSKKENAQRIENMRKTNELIQKLFKDSRLTLVKIQKQKPDDYRRLLKDLILQGLIKLMEPEVNIRCRKSDVAVVERVMAEAAEDYKQIMKAEVKAYQNKEVVINLVLDSNRYLPEFNEASDLPTESCMGGILMHARRGRIVCSNTLDERLKLVYGEAIPEIREKLFPCFTKPPKPEKPVVAAGHHKH